MVTKSYAGFDSNELDMQRTSNIDVVTATTGVGVPQQDDPIAVMHVCAFANSCALG